ncbi:hypothetical protein N7488_002107 [Penicillium malachiteum]|nr:hypothetical protein N7488_002107 [Penicillium malachiteum]
MARHEEDPSLYRLGGYHSVHLGDIFHSQYEVLRKLGYGRYSTIWLVRDQISTSTGCYKALKILTAECYDGSHDIFELEILKRLRNSDPKHKGYPYIPILVDSFEHIGPNGSHVCTVLEPMGESLKTFGTLFPHQIPS